MEDKELVEVWRKEFIDLSKIGGVAAIYEMDRFLNREVELRWQGFLVAKRSQPSVALPKPDDMYDSGNTWQGRYYYEDVISKALTAAGIKYTVKE